MRCHHGRFHDSCARAARRDTVWLSPWPLATSDLHRVGIGQSYPSAVHYAAAPVGFPLAASVALVGETYQ